MKTTLQCTTQFQFIEVCAGLVRHCFHQTEIRVAANYLAHLGVDGCLYTKVNPRKKHVASSSQAVSSSQHQSILPLIQYLAIMPAFTTPSSWRHSRSPGGTRDSASTRRLAHQPFAGEEEERTKAEEPSIWQGMRGHVVAMSGELVGTVLFLWFAFAGNQVASQSTPAATVLEPQGIMFIALSYGMSLLVVAWAFYRISGGLFNPAVCLRSQPLLGPHIHRPTLLTPHTQVTFGMMVSGALPWVRGLLLIPAQIVGAIIAAGLNTCMLPGPIAVITTLTNGTSVRQGLFIEAFLTSLLVFVILMLAAEKHATTHIAPVGIGLALFAAELAG